MRPLPLKLALQRPGRVAAPHTALHAVPRCRASCAPLPACRAPGCPSSWKMWSAVGPGTACRQWAQRPAASTRGADAQHARRAWSELPASARTALLCSSSALCGTLKSCPAWVKQSRNSPATAVVLPAAAAVRLLVPVEKLHGIGATVKGVMSCLLPPPKRGVERGQDVRAVQSDQLSLHQPPPWGSAKRPRAPLKHAIGELLPRVVAGEPLGLEGHEHGRVALRGCEATPPRHHHQQKHAWQWPCSPSRHCGPAWAGRLPPH